MKNTPEALHLYSMRGYHKCEWIFSVIESQVWADWLEGITTSNYKQDLDAIREIAQYGLDRASNTPYIKGLYYLELAKADIFAYAVGEQHDITSVDASLTEAERLLVRARVGFDLPRIYIAKASLYRCQAKKTGDLKLLEQTSTELSKAAEIVRFAKLPLYDLQLQMEKAKIFFVSGKMHELKLILTNAGDLIDRYGFLRYKSDLENLWRVVD